MIKTGKPPKCSHVTKKYSYFPGLKRAAGGCKVTGGDVYGDEYGYGGYSGKRDLKEAYAYRVDPAGDVQFDRLRTA
jgi:hypothetical protein